MSAGILQSALESHAASGMEGLCITVLRKGKIVGVDIHPEWEERLKQHGFEMFAKMYLEPAFAQLQQQIEWQDGSH